MRRKRPGCSGAEFPGGAARCPFVEAHADQLLRASGAAAVVVTLDREGTLTIRPSGDSRKPATHRTWARPQAEKQASGAGDTFVAALTMARAAGLPLTTSVDLAQAAADVVVHRPGTSVCTTDELAKHLRGFADTALTDSELARHVEEHRSEGKRIVLTNGCFDVLHRGHTRYLNQAKQLGDVLVVALNSDSSVRKLKGPDRPVNHEADRAAVIAALSCVDHVTVFDTPPTPIPLIELLRPRRLCQRRRLHAGDAPGNRSGGTLRRHSHHPGLRARALHYSGPGTHPFHGRSPPADLRKQPCVLRSSVQQDTAARNC